MAEAQVAQAQPLIVVDRKVTLSDELVKMAAEGKEIKARLSADKKRIKVIDDRFKAMFEETGLRDMYRPDGTIAVIIGHGSRDILDQERLKAEKPEIVDAYQRTSVFDTPSYQ
jgi:hypothetical protein